MFRHEGSHQPAPRPPLFQTEGADEADDTSGNSLEDAARDEREVARERLRHELDRDPTEEEVSDWLRKHTEGY